MNSLLLRNCRNVQTTELALQKKIFLIRIHNLFLVCTYILYYNYI